MAKDKWNEEEKQQLRKQGYNRKFYFRVRVTSTCQLHTDSLLLCNNKLWFQQAIQKPNLI